MGPWATWLQISGSILDGYEIIGNGGIPTMFFAGYIYIYIHVIIYIYILRLYIYIKIPVRRVGSFREIF